MVVKADILRGAKLRLAQHYLDEMVATEARYQDAPHEKQIILQEFGEELPQIQQMFQWMTTHADDHLNNVTSDYLIASPNLLRALMLHEDLLAWHWRGYTLAERQGNVARQLLHMEQIGQIEQINTLFTDAYQHLRQAWLLARQLRDYAAIASCLYGLARISYGLTRPTSANRLLRQSLHFANPDTQKHLLFDMYLLWNGIARSLGNANDVFTALEHAFKIAETLNDPERLARCKRVYSASLALHSTRYAEMLPYAEEALAVARQYRHPVEIVNCLRVLGIGHVYRGNYEQAMVYFQEAFDLGAQLPTLHQSNLFHYNDMADCLISLNRLDEALDYIEQGALLNQQAHDPICDIFYHAQVGSIRFWQGNLADGMRHMEEWLRLCRQIDTEISFPGFIRRWGDAQLMLCDNPQMALVYYEQGLAGARRRGNPFETCDNLCQIILAYLMLGDLELAQPYFSEASTLAGEMQTPTLVHRVAVGAAFYEAYAGHLAEARTRIANIATQPGAIHPEVQDALILFARRFGDS